MDFARLAYLHRHGGVYADLDYEAIKPLDPLLDTSNAVVAREHRGIGLMLRGRDYVINALMASPAGHPLWLAVMRRMVREYRPRRWLEHHTAYVIRMAIAVLDEQVDQHVLAEHDVTVLSHEQVYPSIPTDRIPAHRVKRAVALNSYGVHHSSNSWRSPIACFLNAGRVMVQRCWPS